MTDLKGDGSTDVGLLRRETLKRLARLSVFALPVASQFAVGKGASAEQAGPTRDSSGQGPNPAAVYCDGACQNFTSTSGYCNYNNYADTGCSGSGTYSKYCNGTCQAFVKYGSTYCDYNNYSDTGCSGGGGGTYSKYCNGTCQAFVKYGSTYCDYNNYSDSGCIAVR
jgi:hypothetical protein